MSVHEDVHADDDVIQPYLHTDLDQLGLDEPPTWPDDDAEPESQAATDAAAGEQLGFVFPPYASWLPWPPGAGSGPGSGGYAFPAGKSHVRAVAPPSDGTGIGNAWYRARVYWNIGQYMTVRPYMPYTAHLDAQWKNHPWSVQIIAGMRVFAAWSDGDVLRKKAEVFQVVHREEPTTDEVWSTNSRRRELRGHLLHAATSPLPWFRVTPGEQLVTEVQVSVNTRGRGAPIAGHLPGTGAYAKVVASISADLKWLVTAQR